MRRLAQAVFAATILGSSALARAQDGGVRPPRVEDMGAGPTWLYALVGAGIIALCVGLVVLPSRRTFED
jgi:hypothetical protein